MKRLTLILLFTPLFAYTQQYDKHWLLSYDGGSPSLGNYRLMFTWNPALQIDSTYALINQNYTTITMSDINGSYMFASNGGQIIDVTGHTMLNGANINMNPCSTAYAHIGSPIAHTMLCLPTPGDSNTYYLLHEPCDFSAPFYSPLKLMYSKIDMRGNGGLGEVIEKNVDIFYDSLAAGEIAACKHSDGQSWWVFIPRTNSNVYHRLVLTNYGMMQQDTIQVGHPYTAQEAGTATFSPDGKYYGRFSIHTGLSLMNFDRCTGQMNEILFKGISAFPSNTHIGSVEFSPNSKVLYVFCLNFILQYDLTALNILSTETNVANLSPIRCPDNLQNGLSYGQLAPDGKIYINGTIGTSCLNYIEYPDSVGTSCNVVQRGLLLPMYICGFSTFPNNPKYRLGPDGQDCGINQLPTVSNSNIQFFPNPASTRIYISGFYEQSAAIEIHNIEGKKVVAIAYTMKDQSIDVSALSPGFYIVSLHSKNKTINRRLVISR